MSADGSRQLSAWLLKKKSGTSVMRVRQYNRRYFTVDFDRREFFYSHGESNKKPTVIPFAEIVEVRRPERREGDPLGDNASECSRQSRTSFMRRMGSGLSKGGGKEHEPEQCVTLVTKPAKTMELICASAVEASVWYEALAAAARSGAEAGSTEVDAPIPSDDSEKGSSGAPSPHGGETAPAANTSGYPEAPRRPPLAPRPQPAATAAELPAGNESAQDGRPPVACGTFLDFSTEPDETGGPEALASKGGDAGASAITSVGAAGANCAPFKVSDFGLTAEDDVDSDDSSSAGDAPAKDAGTGAFVSCPSRGTSKEGAPDTSRSYHDRHEGLSVQQRLANLEFSDDEDADDDDPLGLKAK